MNLCNDTKKILENFISYAKRNGKNITNENIVDTEYYIYKKATVIPGGMKTFDNASIIVNSFYNSNVLEYDNIRSIFDEKDDWFIAIHRKDKRIFYSLDGKHIVEKSVLNLQKRSEEESIKSNNSNFEAIILDDLDINSEDKSEEKKKQSFPDVNNVRLNIINGAERRIDNIAIKNDVMVNKTNGAKVKFGDKIKMPKWLKKDILKSNNKVYQYEQQERNKRKELLRKIEYKEKKEMKENNKVFINNFVKNNNFINNKKFPKRKDVKQSIKQQLQEDEFNKVLQLCKKGFGNIRTLKDLKSDQIFKIKP